MQNYRLCRTMGRRGNKMIRSGHRVIRYDLHRLPIGFTANSRCRSPLPLDRVTQILADWGRLNRKDLYRKHKITRYLFNRYIQPLLGPPPDTTSPHIDDDQLKRILADCGRTTVTAILRKHEISPYEFNKFVRPLLGPQRYTSRQVDIDDTPSPRIDDDQRKRILADCGRTTITAILRRHKISPYEFNRFVRPLLGPQRYTSRQVDIDAGQRKRILADCGKLRLKDLLRKHNITCDLFNDCIRPLLGMKRYKSHVENRERTRRLKAMIKLYYAGLSLRKIGKIHGISGEAVRLQLRGKADIGRHMKALRWPR